VFGEEDLELFHLKITFHLLYFAGEYVWGMHLFAYHSLPAHD